MMLSRVFARSFSSSANKAATEKATELLIRNPATEELVASLPTDTPASVAQKVDAAAAAQKSWAKVPLVEKLAIIERARVALSDANTIQILGETLTCEMGKPIGQSTGEIKALQGRLRFFLDKTQEVLKEQVVSSSSGMEEKITWEPLGVVGNISAWNYPYFVSTNVIIPSLLTGSTVVFKPSEYAALSGMELVKILHEAGVPKDVLIPVVGEGSVGAALSSNPRLGGVFFTGSVSTGERIAQAAAKNLIKVQLELGGKDPTYVCEDFDPKAAAASLADGAMYNTGQSCCSVERIYVHKSIYQEFVDHFVAEVKGFKIGDPRDPKTYIGPLARSQQIGVLKDQIHDAVSKGATVAVGGEPTSVNGKGHYFQPTVLLNVNSKMSVMRDESFGPIIGIQAVNSDEEAVELMNDSNYGLTSGVYTKNRERAVRILEQIQSGTVYWNCCDRVSPNLPWSGHKKSGLGLTLSTEGIRAFTRPKAWHLKTVS